MNTNKWEITTNKKLLPAAGCPVRSVSCYQWSSFQQQCACGLRWKKMKLCSWNKKVIPQLFWGKGCMPKETLALVNISLPIMTNCDNCPPPNSTNATGRNCPCLSFEIWDVCFKRAWSLYVSESVRYFMSLNYNVFVKSACSYLIVCWWDCFMAQKLKRVVQCTQFVAVAGGKIASLWKEFALL